MFYALQLIEDFDPVMFQSFDESNPLSAEKSLDGSKSVVVKGRVFVQRSKPAKTLFAALVSSRSTVAET